MSEKIQNKGISRDKVIISTSLVGIAANILLVIFKAFVGLLSNSIAIILDAVNNLSDVLSSVITIIGTKLAGKTPDKKHPLGHGRIEYISALLVSGLVLYAGVTSLIESVKKIIEPAVPDYSAVTLIIISAAVLAKIFLGLYVRAKGKSVNSTTLTASGTDALFDAIISASVLLSAIIFIIFNLSLEAYLGVMISLFVIRSGYKLLKTTLDDVLGKRIDRELIKSIKQTICEDCDVFGAYDLILHSYGPENYIGSANVEISSDKTADEIDAMERRIKSNVYQKHGVILAGVGIYSMNNKNPEIRKMRNEISGIVMSHDSVLQIHGFYVDLQKKYITFDMIIDYDNKKRKEMLKHIYGDIKSKYPDFTLNINMDIDV